MDVNDRSMHRGAATVGLIDELEDIEARAVLYLRMWCDGTEGQQSLWNELAAAHGPDCGRRCLNSLEDVCEIGARFCRRPLMRHAVACRRLGADEACFANLIAYASENAREEAHMIATTMVRPDMAGALADAAIGFALSLRQMALTRPGAVSPRIKARMH